MSKAAIPEMKKYVATELFTVAANAPLDQMPSSSILTYSMHTTRYMDKRLQIQLNGGRKVTGVLRGYDPFMNIVLDETIEEVSATESHNIGMVVSGTLLVVCIFIDKTANGLWYWLQ